MTAGIASWWTSPPPSVGVAFSSRGVTAVAVGAAAEGRRVATRQTTAPLPPGALVPSLNAANLVDRAAVAGAVKEALDAVGRPRRIAVALPDVVARLSLVRLEKVPARTDERDQLLRFQLRKAAPFPIDAAQLSVAEGRHLDDGAREFIVAVARRDVIEEYEGVCQAAAAHAGVVDLAFNGVLHLVQAQTMKGSGDQMVVYLSADGTSLAILRDQVPIFFRTRSADSDASLADVVHQTAMYYEDRLEGRGFSRVLVIGIDGAGADGRAAIDMLGERLRVAVETVDPSRLVGPVPGTPGGTQVDPSEAAPALGLALRESVA